MDCCSGSAVLLQCQGLESHAKPPLELAGPMLSWTDVTQIVGVRRRAAKWASRSGMSVYRRTDHVVPPIGLDFLCHSNSAPIGPAMSALLSGRLSLPRSLYCFSLQPTGARVRLWRGSTREMSRREKGRTDGDAAQPRRLISRSGAGKTSFGASTTTYQSTGSSLLRPA
jgi:hypothetical protein